MPDPDEAHWFADEIRACNDALASMREHGGRWWGYSGGHNVFNLVVGNAMADPEFGGNVVLVFSCCEYIAGPTEWENQRLELARVREPVTADGEGGDWIFVLRDRTAGFELRARYFHRFERDHDLCKRPNLY